jgi:hydroxypyruvate isomerase
MISRRTSLRHLAALGGAALAIPSMSDAESSTRAVVNGRIKQSVVPWCFAPMPVPELIDHAVALGLSSVELCAPEFWPSLRERGITCAIAGSHGFAKGFAHLEEHAECQALLRQRIDQCAEAGVERVITFSGYRRGLTDKQGIENMVSGLGEILPYAEKKKVTLCLEMLNSRVHVEMHGHPDYFCDDIERSIEVLHRLSSERMKLLFDIYHVQIMHGDIITRLRQYAPYIAHVHTAGVPGRNELDDTQELNYPAIMKALIDIGYQGYVGQEFIPLRDKVASLRDAVKLCDV